MVGQDPRQDSGNQGKGQKNGKQLQEGFLRNEKQKHAKENSGGVGICFPGLGIGLSAVNFSPLAMAAPFVVYVAIVDQQFQRDEGRGLIGPKVRQPVMEPRRAGEDPDGDPRHPHRPIELRGRNRRRPGKKTPPT